ncbi:MAG: FtsX-like permease family protein [Saprospiraceae bacterium]|nr:FtsX-like permease family protein [Saprospiraceae bacterium]
MFTHYLRFLFRKQPVFTGLNFAGLVTGMTAALLLFCYVRYEYQYDLQSPHAAQIWRVYNLSQGGGKVTLDANTHSAIGPVLKAELSGVTDYARLYCGSSPEMVVLAGEQPFELARCYATDPGFFRMFPAPFLFGDAANCLNEPYSAVLARSQAMRLFGMEDATGKTLEITEGMLAGRYTIRGVVADPPLNTHLKFDMLLSYATRYAMGHRDNFESYWDYNYLQLAPGFDPETVRGKLAELSEAHLKSEGIRLDIQRFTDIHLHSDLTYELEPNSSARTVYFLRIIALLILGIAFINYINLATAFAHERGKEVGIRKALGAGKGMLIGQFLLESVLLSLAAFGASALCFWQLLPWFGQLTGNEMADTPDLSFWAGSAAWVLLIALPAGLYPALLLSGFRPAVVLRGQFAGSHAESLRKGLVVVQFSCSIGLIFGVLVVSKQLDFLKNHELGVQLDQLVAVKSVRAGSPQDSLAAQRIGVFKTACAQLPGVGGLASSSVAPGLGINGISGSNRPLRWTEKPDYVGITSYFVETDAQFFDLMGIKVLAGEHRLQANETARYRTVSINRAMLEALGFPSPEAAVGREIAYENSENGATMIIGAVVDNFHIESLKTTPKPTLYYCFPPAELQYLTVKIAPEHISATLPAMQKTWSRLFPDQPFRYWMLDEHFARQYQQETRFGQIFGLFAALAIAVSCLGLLGLTAYQVQRRRKEIGIRKVLGASIAGITGMLTGGFLKLIFVAFLLASPFAYYFMHQWLANFAYRIEIESWMFLLAGALSIVVALLTVGIQSLKAAWANPVKALRNE